MDFGLDWKSVLFGVVLSGPVMFVMGAVTGYAGRKMDERRERLDDERRRLDDGG